MLIDNRIYQYCKDYNKVVKRAFNSLEHAGVNVIGMPTKNLLNSKHIVGKYEHDFLIGMWIHLVINNMIIDAGLDLKDIDVSDWETSNIEFLVTYRPELETYFPSWKYYFETKRKSKEVLI